MIQEKNNRNICSQRMRHVCCNAMLQYVAVKKQDTSCNHNTTQHDASGLNKLFKSLLLAVHKISCC